MSVKRFTTKPVEIEAIQFTGTNFDEIQEWSGRRIVDTWETFYFYPIGTYMLDDEEARRENLKGEVFDVLHYTWIGVKPGQWIIKGQKGEFYPCDPETFAWKYEEV